MCDLNSTWPLFVVGAFFLTSIMLSTVWWVELLHDQLAYQRNIIRAYKKKEASNV